MAKNQQNQEQQDQSQELSDLDRRYELAKDELYERMEAEGVELVKVVYNGEGNVSNYDIAPYNIVKDEASDYVGRSALINPGDEFALPKELAAACFLTYGFEPVDEAAEEVAEDPEEVLAEFNEDVQKNEEEPVEEGSDQDQEGDK